MLRCWFAEVCASSYQSRYHISACWQGKAMGLAQMWISPSKTVLLQAPLTSLPVFHPLPTTAVSPATLPPVPPAPHCWGFPSSRSDVLPVRLLSLLTTLPETQTGAHSLTHTYTHTYSAVQHVSVYFKGTTECDEQSKWEHRTNYQVLESLMVL